MDMSWLVEASRKAQEKRQQFASPSISQHIPTGFTGLAEQKQPAFKMPLSPREKAGQAIEQMRQEQAQRPVVPTISGQRLMEDIRRQQEAEKQAREQWAYQLTRDKLEDERYEKEWEYKVRQDAIANALKSKADEESYDPLMGTPWIETQTERDRYLKELAGNEINSIVNHIVADGGKWKDIKPVIDSRRPQLASYALNYGDALLRALEEYEAAINREVSYRPLMMGGSVFDRMRIITQRADKAQRADKHSEYLKDLEKARKEVNEILLREPLRGAEQEKIVEQHRTTYTPGVNDNISGGNIRLP